MEICFECLVLIHENSFIWNHTSLQMKIFIYDGIHAIWKKNCSLHWLPFPLCLPSQNIFILLPILKKKKSNFCRLHLAPDFQSDKSVSWIFPSLLSVFMRDLFVAGLVGFSICLHQERQVYSLGVVCNLQPTYFLPLICLSHLFPPLFEFRRLHSPSPPPPLFAVSTKLRSYSLKYRSSSSTETLVSGFCILIWLIESGLG